MRQDNRLINQNIRVARQHLAQAEELLEEAIAASNSKSYLADLLQVALRNAYNIEEKLRVANNLTETRV